MPHTPGPWHAARHAVNDKNESTVASVHCPMGEGTSAEDNALLIAAAPDLLHALEGLNHMGGDDRGGYCICPKKDGSAPDEKHATSCADARKAIRRAHGTA